MAVFALSAVVASTASASKPEWKGPFPKTFTVTNSTHQVAFGHFLVLCQGEGTGQGKITAAKKGSVIFKWTECRYSLGSCHSAGAKSGEIVSNELSMELGYIKKASKTEPAYVGVGLTPSIKKGKLVEAECPYGEGTEQKLPLLIKGGVIGGFDPINRETNKFELEIAENGFGEQAIQNLEGNEKETLEVSFNGSVYEPIALNARDTAILTEALTEVIA